MFGLFGLFEACDVVLKVLKCQEDIAPRAGGAYLVAATERSKKGLAFC
jgi:hypothetical protein